MIVVRREKLVKIYQICLESFEEYAETVSLIH